MSESKLYYRVIFNEWKIVDSSESHLNHSLGLEIHLLGKFTSYILVLWYQTYHNVEKWVIYSHKKILQQIAGYNVEMYKIDTKIKPMPLSSFRKGLIG